MDRLTVPGWGRVGLLLPPAEPVVPRRPTDSGGGVDFSSSSGRQQRLELWRLVSSFSTDSSGNPTDSGGWDSSSGGDSGGGGDGGGGVTEAVAINAVRL